METTASRPRKSFVSMAKKGFSRCQRKLVSLTHKVRRPEPSAELADPILEAVFAKMDIEDRIRVGMLSRRALHIVERMPLVLPFLMIRSCDEDMYEVRTDNMEMLVAHILQHCPGFRFAYTDRITFRAANSDHIIHTILSRVAGFTQFWIEVSDTSGIIDQICDYYVQLEQNTGLKKKLFTEQLTVVGADDKGDMAAIARLITLTRKHLKALRFRHSRMYSDPESSAVWTAIGKCSHLQQMQYEPCRVDQFSREYIVDALNDKELSSLILTGIYDLLPSDVMRITTNSNLNELAVVGNKIPLGTYSDPKAKHLLKGLDSLLIQLEASFELEDSKSREHLLQILATLPDKAYLEVIHVTRGTVSDITRLLSYWIHLARDTQRNIKLKLDECTQEKQDAAVGRLLRKSKDSCKQAWTNHALTLSSGVGKVIVLDRNTWFGDEE